jgi:hypothetical protein
LGGTHDNELMTPDASSWINGEIAWSTHYETFTAGETSVLIHRRNRAGAQTMSDPFRRSINELMIEFEINSAELVRNSEDMKLLMKQAERGELTAEEIDAKAQVLLVESDRRRQLVSAYRDVRSTTCVLPESTRQD